jgi:16S rRNA (guanine966-N2)-methyltransferase
MRIIAGRFKGTKLPSVKGKSVRPTASRVRESLFSVIGSDIDGAQVLDLFAGSGAFGFEAVSRGAERAVLVDQNRDGARNLAKAVELLRVEDQVEILSMGAAQAIRLLEQQGRKFSVIFLDPPYASDLAQRITGDPSFPGLLTDEGIIILERRSGAPAIPMPPCFEMYWSRKYGDTQVEIFHFSDDSQIP